MSATTKVHRCHELRAILHVIRQGWNEEERARRQRIAEAKQQWLYSLVADTETQKRAS